MAITKTEQTILESAERVFLRKGLEVATMQDIAAEAGISRTLLHYYHRNKSTLFQAILEHTINDFMPLVTSILEKDIPMAVKLERIIDCYIDFLLEKPLIPFFITMEFRRDPEYLIKKVKERGCMKGDLSDVKKEIAREMKIKTCSDEAVAHIFTTMYGLIMFPFLVRPVLDHVFLNNDPEAFRTFMLQKKKLVLHMIETLWEDLKKDSLELSLGESKFIQTEFNI